MGLTNETEPESNMAMNAQDLLKWAKSKKAELEEKGRTKGGQYRMVLEWVDVAKKLQSVPQGYTPATIEEKSITDPRAWAARMMEADAPLRMFVKFGQPLNDYI